MLPYDALAAVYDRWTEKNDYHRWAAFIDAVVEGTQVLDLCCGTGRLTAILQQKGYRMTGADRSKAMLDYAANALDPGTPLYLVDLTATSTGHPSWAYNQDAVLCSFDSVNYFAGDGELQALLSFASRSLRTGGLFVFDVNTRYKLETVFGDSHYGDDLEDFGYVWRNRYDPAAGGCRFLITLYTCSGTVFERQVEEHWQRWFDHEELTRTARHCGFSVQSTTDDYGSREVTGETLRETWILRKD